MSVQSVNCCIGQSPTASHPALVQPMGVRRPLFLKLSLHSSFPWLCFVHHAHFKLRTALMPCRSDGGSGN